MIRSERHKGKRSAGDAEAPLGVELFLYFVAVAQDLSFTAAGRRLGIDQSWLSQKIREFERKLGCALFVRTTRRMELTEEGLALLEPARQLAQSLDDARRQALGLSASLPGRLDVGALPLGFWSPERVKLIDRFMATYPDTEVNVHTGPSPWLLERLRAGEIDIAFVSGPFEGAGLEVLSLREDRYCLLIPHGHPLQSRAAIRFEDVRGHRLAMMREQHSPEAIKALFSPFLEAGGVAVEVGEFEREALVRAAARHHLLVVSNVMEAPLYVGDHFVARPIESDLKNYKYLVRRAGFSTTPIKAFWALALEVAAGETSRQAVGQGVD